MTEILVKVAITAITVSALVLVLKSDRQEFGFLVSAGASAVLLFMVAKAVFPSVNSMVKLYENSLGNKGIIKTVIKVLVISYLAEFCSDTCCDFGQTALGKKAEFAGRCAVFVVCVPLINSIIETATEITGI